MPIIVLSGRDRRSACVARPVPRELHVHGRGGPSAFVSWTLHAPSEYKFIPDSVKFTELGREAARRASEVYVEEHIAPPTAEPSRWRLTAAACADDVRSRSRGRRCVRRQQALRQRRSHHPQRRQLRLTDRSARRLGRVACWPANHPSSRRRAAASARPASESAAQRQAAPAGPGRGRAGRGRRPRRPPAPQARARWHSSKPRPAGSLLPPSSDSAAQAVQRLAAATQAGQRQAQIAAQLALERRVGEFMAVATACAVVAPGPHRSSARASATSPRLHRVVASSRRWPTARARPSAASSSPRAAAWSPSSCSTRPEVAVCIAGPLPVADLARQRQAARVVVARLGPGGPGQRDAAQVALQAALPAAVLQRLGQHQRLAVAALGFGQLRLAQVQPAQAVQGHAPGGDVAAGLGDGRCADSSICRASRMAAAAQFEVGDQAHHLGLHATGSPLACARARLDSQVRARTLGVAQQLQRTRRARGRRPRADGWPAAPSAATACARSTAVAERSGQAQRGPGIEQGTRRRLRRRPGGAPAGNDQVVGLGAAVGAWPAVRPGRRSVASAGARPPAAAPRAGTGSLSPDRGQLFAGVVLHAAQQVEAPAVDPRTSDFSTSACTTSRPRGRRRTPPGRPRPRPREREAALEHRQLRQRRLFGRRQQVPGPVQRGAQRGLAVAAAAAAGQQLEALAHALQQHARRHHARPRRGQFDGQRQAVEQVDQRPPRRLRPAPRARPSTPAACRRWRNICTASSPASGASTSACSPTMPSTSRLVTMKRRLRRRFEPDGPASPRRGAPPARSCPGSPGRPARGDRRAELLHRVAPAQRHVPGPGHGVHDAVHAGAPPTGRRTRRRPGSRPASRGHGAARAGSCRCRRCPAA